MTKPVHSKTVSLGVGAALLFVGLLAGSCRDVVGGENLNVLQHLCARLQQCFSEEGDAICDRIMEDAPVSGEWGKTLGRFDKCVEGDCGVIRSCLGLDAFCIEHTSSAKCGTDFECCGAGLGAADCETNSCCLRLGFPCADESECCGNAGCLPVGSTRTCGGVICQFVGDACDSNGDCCTGICDGGVCANIVCLQAGDACDGGCCAELNCVDGTCKGPVVGCESGEVCEPSDSCCTGDDLCLVGPNGIPTCSDCGLEGADCAQNSDCCGACVPYGGSLRCSAEVCLDTGEECTVSTDCCSGSCVSEPGSDDSACAESSCVTSCEQDPCKVGVGLTLGQDCYPDVIEDAVAEVVATDPLCLCTWDEICIEDFLKLAECP